MNNNINDIKLLRLHDVIAIIPISRSSWLNGVKTGRFPKPIRISPRTIAWRESDIKKLVENLPAND